MTTLKPTFDVDKKGLQKILTRRGIEFAVLELIQNAFDELTTVVSVVLQAIPGTRRYRISVTDDNPEGFKDLSHAYTLFAESEKKANPEQRGRFNLGEKLVIAACDTASICTTKGTVKFEGNHRTLHPRLKQDAGSTFLGEMKMTKDEAARVEKIVFSVIVPQGIVLTFNGASVVHRDPIATDEVTLATEITDDEGNLRPTRRKTMVEIYEPLAGETPTLYEMGLPVVETEDRFHVNVMQKIPVSMDRESVITPSYLRDIRTFVVNATADILDGKDASENWVSEALCDDDITPTALEQIMVKRYGEKRVAYDPSDPEANKLAVSKGYTVIHGRMLPGQAWENVRRFDAARPAGQVTPSPKPYSNNPDGTPRLSLPKDKWTDGVKEIAKFSRWLARELMDVDIDVDIVSDARCRNFSATYGRLSETRGALEFNWRTLGRSWFDQKPYSPEVLRLVIHEFGHHTSSDHLSSRYHEALCLLGAKMAQVALDHPERFGR